MLESTINSCFRQIDHILSEIYISHLLIYTPKLSIFEIDTINVDMKIQVD